MKKTSRIQRFLLTILIAVLLAGAVIPAESVPVQAAVNEYYQSKLSGKNLKIYNGLVKTTKKNAKKYMSLDLSKGSRKLNGSIASIIKLDHPELFWLQSWSQMTFSFSDSDDFFYSPTYISGAYKKNKTFKAKVNKIVKSLKKKCKGKSQVEKARIIHDYVCSTATYKQSKYDQTAYGILVQHKAVCAGYAAAYKLLCDRLGVKCICVAGYVNGVGHELNYVKIKGKYYLVDCTWDDNYGSGWRYTYFMRGSSSTGCKLAKCYGVKIPKLSKTDLKIPR